MLSYGIKKEDENGCVHSIDNLVVEYVVRDMNAKSVLDALAELFRQTVKDWNEEKSRRDDNPPASKFAWFRSSIWGDGFYIQYGQYREYDKVEKKWYEFPLLRMKFNPNKYFEHPFLEKFLTWAADRCENGCIVKFDYTVDVPTRPAHIMVDSRKEYGLHKGTKYYGQRNKHGHLKVYDKRVESGLETNLTRVEWTFCHGKQIAFDAVTWLRNGPVPLLDVDELGKQPYNVVRLIATIKALGGDVEEALSLFDRRTRKKIEPYTVGSGIQLLEDDMRFVEWLLQYYCDVMSVSYSSPNVNIGSMFTRLSSDDLEAFEDMPF